MLHPYLWFIVWSVIPRESSLVTYTCSWLCVYGFPFCTHHLHLRNALTVSFVDINTVREYYSSSSPFRTPTQSKFDRLVKCFHTFSTCHYRLKSIRMNPTRYLTYVWAFLVKFLAYLRKKSFRNLKLMDY